MNQTENERATNVARLDGFLNGVLSLSGRIREYSAFASMMDSVTSPEQVEAAVQKRFLPQGALIRSIQVCELPGGQRDLEHELRDLLIRDILNVGADRLGNDALSDRKKFLSFRVMDLVNELVGSGKRKVYRALVVFENSHSVCTFFLVPLVGYTLALQFNDDRAQRPISSGTAPE